MGLRRAGEAGVELSPDQPRQPEGKSDVVRQAAAFAVTLLVLAAALSARNGMTGQRTAHDPGARTGAGVAAGDLEQQDGRPQVSFRSGVDLVLVDVSVLDRHRRPIRGLTASDFVVLESGKPQTIETFAAIDIPDTDAAAAPWTREVAPDVRRSDDGRDRRLIVFVLDDATPMPAADIPRVKELARQSIAGLGPDDLAAVVFAWNKSAGQPFTRDRSRLLACVEKFNGGIDKVWTMSADGMVSAAPFDKYTPGAKSLYDATVGTLQGIAEMLAELPERRKAVVFISVGVPAGEGVFPSKEPGEGQDTDGTLQKTMGGIGDVVNAARRANVNIYALDPGGLRGPVIDSGAIDAETGAAEASSLNLNPGVPNRGFLRTVSEDTGGFAVTATNDVSAGISQIYRENGSYYLLGYRSPNSRVDGRFRQIEVRLKEVGPGTILRARSGYYAPRAGASRDQSPPKAATSGVAPITGALTSLVPVSDISLKLWAAPFAGPGEREAAVAVVLGLRPPATTGEAGRVETLDVTANAYDLNGRLRRSESRTAKIVMRSLEGDVDYEIALRMPLPPGRYQLRVAARSALSGKSGSVFRDLDVPDFSRPAVRLSQIALARTPPLATAGTEVLQDLLPIAPTAEREFATFDSLTAFVQVHNPPVKGAGSHPAPVVLASTIVDERGATVFEREELLEPEPGRLTNLDGAGFRLDLPAELLSSLGPGQYLLTIAARLAGARSEPPGTAGRGDGRTLASREVRFVLQ